MALLCSAGPQVAAQSSLTRLADCGRWKELQGLVGERLKANPNDPEAQWLLSRVRVAFHDIDDALAPAERAVALAPGNAEYHWQLAQVYGTQAERAGVLHQLGLAHRFKTEAEAALAIDPTLVDALMGLMEYYARAPVVAGGDDHKADALATRLAAISKTDGVLARIRLRQQEKPAPSSAELARLYEQAIEAGPARYDPRIDVSELYLGETPPRIDLAEKHALAARTIDPERIDAYRLLASVYAFTASWPKLDADLDEATAHVRDDWSPWLSAATVLSGTGTDLPRAERYARKYLSAAPEPDEPTLAYAHWQLGLILEKEARRPDAIAELETAVRLDPKLDAAKLELKKLTR